LGFIDDCYMALKDYSKALEVNEKSFQTALKLGGTSQNVLTLMLRLGTGYLLVLKNYEKAIESYDKVCHDEILLVTREG